MGITLLFDLCKVTFKTTENYIYFFNLTSGKNESDHFEVPISSLIVIQTYPFFLPFVRPFNTLVGPRNQKENLHLSINGFVRFGRNIYNIIIIDSLGSFGKI